MSSEPPRDVLTGRLQQAIGGRKVDAAVFTTFRFEPGFFEQEVLTALFDVTWHHVPKLRRLQFEDLLRRLSGRLAVYYDQRALVEGDLGSAALDIRRIPCRPSGGYFHPKVILVLVEGPALVAMVSSANLTRAGWWENVEAAAVEELRAGEPSRMRDELEGFADHLRKRTADVREHEALDAVRTFVRTVPQMQQRSWSGRLHTHFYANGRTTADTVTDFIADATRGTLDGWSLDVISPYVDGGTHSQPLEDLVAAFRPKSVRVLVPDDDGIARCTPALYDSVRDHGWQWGRLPADLTRRSSDERATPRMVHAKVLRFFAEDREIVFAGSVNLTTAGHQAAGNVEAAMLFERRPGQPLHHWLTPDDERPAFLEPVPEEEGTDTYAPPLVLRYDWSTATLSALWSGRVPNPGLGVRAHGVELLAVPAASLSQGKWRDLDAIDAAALEQRLRASSFLTAVDEDGREGVLLVLEIGMAHRPSLLLDLTPAEIVQYWALLTPEQRAGYIGDRGEALEEVEGGEALVAGTCVEERPESMFERFAGMFHGFASLERKVMASLDEGRSREAEFLVVGKKPDSLPRLVDRIAERTSAATRVDDYLLLLCAEQLVRRIKQEHPAFWRDTPGTAALEAALALRGTLRSALAVDDEMARFLDWHARQFLRPAEPRA